MRKLSFLIFVLSLFINNANAGFTDPWYLMYRVSGGQITQILGPFNSQFECSSAKFNLPFGSTFLGCAQ
jgi:hypothetical protein